jgi:CheY-like chemotaxis protein
VSSLSWKINSGAGCRGEARASEIVAECSFFFPTSAPKVPSAPSGSARQRGAPAKRRPRGELAGLRVLVVEDDADARELVSTILEDAGAIVSSADSAASGFDAVSAFHPQLLVSDIGMPGEDGYSLIRRIRALGVEAGGGLPSVALTAFTRPEDRARALTAGFTVHMGKPVSPTELVTTLKNLASQLRN